MDDFKNLAYLTKIIDLCRRKGVQSLKIEGIELTLRGELPPSNYKKKKDEKETIEVETPYGDEAALFWSSAGIPGSEGIN